MDLRHIYLGFGTWPHSKNHVPRIITVVAFYRMWRGVSLGFVQPAPVVRRCSGFGAATSHLVDRDIAHELQLGDFNP